MLIFSNFYIPLHVRTSFTTVSNVQSTTRILSKRHYHAFVRRIGNTMLPNAIRVHPTYDPVTFNVSFMAALIDFDEHPTEILHESSAKSRATFVGCTERPLQLTLC